MCNSRYECLDFTIFFTMYLNLSCFSFFFDVVVYLFERRHASKGGIEREGERENPKQAM